MQAAATGTHSSLMGLQGMLPSRRGQSQKVIFSLVPFVSYVLEISRTLEMEDMVVVARRQEQARREAGVVIMGQLEGSL